MAKAKEAKVREAIAVFRDAKLLQSAIGDLLRTGFERSQLGLLAGETVVKDQLADLYHRTEENQDPEKAPAIAFVSRDAIGEAGESMSGSLYFVGTSGLAGAIVASAAIFGGALTTAVGGVLGVGLVGLAVSAMIQQSDAEELQQRVDEGHILLFVRLPHGAREQEAKSILARYSTTEVKVHEVPIASGEAVESD